MLDIKEPLYKVEELEELRIRKKEHGIVHKIYEGDNIDSLTILKEQGYKVDLCYIDPPYNTGSTFHYKDTYGTSNNWLGFMRPRLELGYDLLNEDGVIFIHIGIDELASLKLLCDELYDKNNFINLLSRVTGQAPKMLSKHFSSNIDYILVYAKSKSKLILSKNKDMNLKDYKFEDAYVKERGKYMRTPLNNNTLKISPSMYYPIECPDGSLTYPDSCYKIKGGRSWRFNKERYEWSLANGFITFHKSKEGWRVGSKAYQFVDHLNNPKEHSKPFINLLDSFYNANGHKALKDLELAHLFSYPKPVDLLKFIIDLHPNNNAVVLDFFAGSGTTGHAVLELNDGDGGNRQAILCTNNENNICRNVTYERLSRVLKGYETPSGKLVEGIDSNLDYYKVSK